MDPEQAVLAYIRQRDIRVEERLGIWRELWTTFCAEGAEAATAVLKRQADDLGQKVRSAEARVNEALQGD